MRFVNTLWELIKKIQSITGTILFLLVALIFTLFILRTFVFDSKTDNLYSKSSALVIDFRGQIVEQRSFSNDPYEQILEGSISSNTLLRDVIKAIDLAQNDKNIDMLVLNFDRFSGAYPSKLHFIGQQIEKFKMSGKKVVSYGAIYNQAAYLLASFSNEIYMHPQGATLLYGYGGYQNYFLGFLEKINAEVQLFRVGKYKSAMEPFIRSDMSSEAKAVSRELYGGLWDDYVSEVARQRSLDENEIKLGIENADQLLMKLDGDLGQLALKSSLIDGLKTRAEWVSYMQEQVGKGDKTQEINQIYLRDYLSLKMDLPDLK